MSIRKLEENYRNASQYTECVQPIWWTSITSIGRSRTQKDLGPVSISDKTSYGKISWSLEATRLIIKITASLLNITGISAFEVPLKFRGDRTILNTNLAALRLCEILKWGVLSDIKTGPGCQFISDRIAIVLNVLVINYKIHLDMESPPPPPPPYTHRLSKPLFICIYSCAVLFLDTCSNTDVFLYITRPG